jgi:hypothetical protein
MEYNLKQIVTTEFFGGWFTAPLDARANARSSAHRAGTTGRLGDCVAVGAWVTVSGTVSQ